MLLLFMLYDPEKVEIRYIGRFYVRSTGTPFEIISKLNQMAEFSPNEAIVLYKEEKSPAGRMCKYIDKDITFQSCELHDGDIICYQKASIEDSKEKLLYPDFPSFLEHANNHRVVHFRLLNNPTEDVFCLELSKLLSHDDIAAKVARQIGIDDRSKIRLTSHNHLLRKPMPQPIECPSLKHLSDMLCVSQDLSMMLPNTQKIDILYYEVLDTLSELQCSKSLFITFRYASRNEATLRFLMLPGNSTVGDALNKLRMVVELSAPDVQLRLLQVKSHKIYKIFADDEHIENIDESNGTLCAEEILEEEKNLGPQDVLVNVFQFFKDSDGIVPFGEPFCIIVREGETLADIKPRIQMKLRISADECSKWAFAFCYNGQHAYIDDSSIMALIFKSYDTLIATNYYLGLEHEDTTVEKQNIEKQSEQFSQQEF